MTTMFLVRHGQTEYGDGRYAGSTDVALTAVGVAQAERLGTWAAGTGIDGIATSPLARARRTAEPAARATGLIPIIDPRLREPSFGEGEGLTGAEMERRFPEARRAFLASPASNALPGGEPGRDVIARAVPALRSLAADHPDERLLVVTHNTLIRLVLCALLGIDPDRYREVFPAVANGAVTTVELDGDPDRQAALLAYNAPIAT